MKTAFSDRALPPQNIDAEESILGGILLDPEAIARVIKTGLQEKDFYVEAHRKLFRTMEQAFNQGQPTDLMTISSRLKDLGLLEKVGGTTKLVHIVDRTVSAVNVDKYAELVIEKSDRRKIINKSNELIDSAYRGDIPLEVCRDQAGEMVRQLIESTRTGKKRFKHISETLIETFQKIEEANANLNNPDYKKLIKTGYPSLDKFIIELEKGNMTMILGDTAMGKSVFAQNIAVNIAEKYAAVLYFTTGELSDVLVTRRFLSRASGVSLSALRSGNLIINEYRDDNALLISGMNKLAEIPLFIHSESLTIHQIHSEVADFKDTHPEHEDFVVVIDYIQNVDREGSRAMGHEQIVEIMHGGKKIAATFDTHVIATSQVKQEVSSRNNKRPTIFDTDGSKSISNKPQLVLGLYRDEYYNPDTTEEPGIMEVICLKDTSNESNWTVKLRFDGEVATISDVPIPARSYQTA